MRRRKSTKFHWILTSILTVLLVSSLTSRCARPREDYPRDEAPRLEEVWSFGSGTAKVVRIPLEGVIMRANDEGLFPEPDMVETVLVQIRAATRDAEVKAIILEVNSPGGGVTPSDEIYNALQRFKENTERKVVIFFRDLGASGAYYAAMAGDLLIAEPTSVIGSIGVIMQSINIEGLAEKIGITDITIKSGENKDLLNPFQAVSTNQVALMQALIDDMQSRFAGIVSDARNLDPAENPDLFDGRVYSANDARENKLIDEIGYWEDALARTAQLLDVGALRVIRYRAEESFFDLLMNARSLALPDLRSMAAPQFLYLWKP